MRYPQSDKHRVWPFKFHSVGVAWQCSTCQAMGHKFVKANGVSPGSGDTPLTRPDMRSIKKILGDGNCMFRALSCIVTNSQDLSSVLKLYSTSVMRLLSCLHICDSLYEKGPLHAKQNF